jgi:hypothetical protein
MNEIWVLSIRTSLPKVCYAFGDMNLNMQCFDSFEKAKAAFRESLKSFAFTKNAMFDGKGRIKYFDEYIKRVMSYDVDYEDDEGILTGALLAKIQNGLTTAFSGQETNLDIHPDFYTDWMIASTVTDDFVAFCGDDDGPINGYNPVLQTNIFSMEKEQDYYLYIDDRFGQDDATSELYIDLKKVSVL